MPVEGGGTLREMLLAAKRAGEDPPELKIPEPPPELHTVLPLFQRLTARRPYEQGIPLSIPYREIEALCNLEGRKLQRWEIECIDLLDTIFLKVAAKARKD